MLLTAVPSVGGLLGIVGFILVLLAIREISDVVADRSIFRNMIVAVVLGIAGIITVVFVVAASIFAFIGLNALNFGPNFNPNTVPAGDWIGLIGSVILGLLVFWVLMLISAIYIRRTYRAIGLKLHVGMFETAGLIYLIGAATTIILVGFLLLLVAEILLVVAFLAIEDKPLVAPAQMAQPAPLNP